MDSNTLQGYQHHHHQQQQQEPNSGLLRFRSAPSSLLANLTPPFSESEALVSTFVSYGTDNSSNNNDTASPSFQEFGDNTAHTNTNNKKKDCDFKGLSGMNSQQGYGGGVGLPPHYPRHGSSASSSGSAFDGGSYGLVGSMGVEQKDFGSSSNLLRQSSSPAGLFSNNFSFQNGIVLLSLFCSASSFVLIISFFGNSDVHVYG